MNGNNEKIRLVMKMMFKFLKDIHFIYKITLLKEFRIQLSRRLKNYKPGIRQNVEKVDYQGAKARKFFQIFK